MELKKIYFDAFKSLLNKELIITEGCVGFVGINESGKSNILEAINVLGSARRLQLSDTPKMEKDNNPSIRYEFALNATERTKVITAMQHWVEENGLVKKALKSSTFSVTYHVEYNKINEEEERYYELSEFNFNKDCLVLRKDKKNESYKIKDGDIFVPINQAIIISKTTFEKNKEHFENCIALEKLNDEINTKELEIKEIAESEGEEVEKETTEVVESSEDPKPSTDPGSKKTIELTARRGEIGRLRKAKIELEDKVGDFDSQSLIKLYQKLFSESESNITSLQAEVETVTSKVAQLVGIESRDDAQNSELTTNQELLKTSNKQIQAEKKKNKDYEKLLNILNEPLSDKYTDDSAELNKHIPSEVINILDKLLPKVVFWKYSDDYVLESTTAFSELKKQDSLENISRPLVNVFRICLGIKTIEELKEKIAEIETDQAERSRLNDTFNREIKNYLKDVWPDYDQEIKITLEEHQIRIEFYDPERIGASYYSMQERSQGCQTFISFLLTIGAEANKGVINRTVLLLDEPEIHLHPSGVRYMLKELIKIAGRGNTVLFATHSVFMIDRNNYNRHIILKKSKEYTDIQPSSYKRIGFFMQEEVLYKALDINLSEDFKSTNLYNFVFEGDGDATIFKHYYENILKNTERPFDLSGTSFYQGGKCSDIRKYFNQSPIQLGTKWILILDKDKPANDLKSFMEAKYDDYLNKDVFVFQYNTEKVSSEEFEMEDILPLSMLTDTYVETSESFTDSLDQKLLKPLINGKTSFSVYNEKVLNTYYKESKEEFKAKFKELLNQKIRIALDNIKNESEFDSKFPEYHKWVKKIISSINELVKKKKAVSSP